MSKKGTVAVIGLGYVGLPLSLLASDKGYTVVGIDKDERKVKLLNQRKSPIKDAELIKKVAKTKMAASATPNPVAGADVVIVCVPTPVSDDYRPDLGPLKSAVEFIAQYLRKNQLIVIESTINPGVCDEIVIPLLEKLTGMKDGKDFYVAHCPERINPGDKTWNVSNIARVVGSSSAKGLKLAYDFYTSLIDAPVKAMGSIKEAEAVKVVENSFRDINIAFVNELAMSFEKLGIDVVNVIEGAATKPFAFMPHFPGAGVGGHCIPVDPYYLIEYARESGFEHDFLRLARRINNGMPEFTVNMMVQVLNDAKLPLKGTPIAVLGLAYKPNVEDDRESPAYEIVARLKELGAKVTAYDPYLPEKSDAKTLKEAIKGTKAVLIATGHNEFKKLTPAQLKSAGVKAVVDGRNIFNPQAFKKAGILYKGIGR